MDLTMPDEVVEMPDNENEKKENKGYGKALFGRRVIYTDFPKKWQLLI